MTKTLGKSMAKIARYANPPKSPNVIPRTQKQIGPPVSRWPDHFHLRCGTFQFRALRRRRPSKAIPPRPIIVRLAGSGTAPEPPPELESKAEAKALPNSAVSCAGESTGLVLPNVVPKTDTSLPSHVPE